MSLQIRALIPMREDGGMEEHRHIFIPCPCFSLASCNL